MRKIKYSDTNITKTLINKMLEKHGVTVEDIERLEDYKIDGKDWFTYYTWTQKESDEYRRWFCQYFLKNVSPKMPMKKILQMYEWFNADRGLKIEENGKS